MIPSPHRWGVRHWVGPLLCVESAPKSGGVSEAMRLMARGFAQFLRVLALLGLGLVGIAQAADGEAGHYFLVIDHSGSMLTPLKKGPEPRPTRWELMRERASGFIERLPEGADAWAIVFNAEDPAPQGNKVWQRTFSRRLDSPAGRAQMIGFIGGYPAPARPNGTWLRQATSLALDQAERVGAGNPKAYLTVMVYTDGKDEGHGITSEEIRRNKGSTVSEEQLSKRIASLRQRFRNFNLLEVYRPGDESIRDAHVVRLSTNRVQLANPRIEDQQLHLEFAFRDSPALRLQGLPLKMTLETEDGRSLRLTGGPFKLTNGKVSVGVPRQDDWPPGKDVRATLKVQYPTFEDAYLVAEGGNTVDVLIQGAEKPGIRDLQPAAGSVHQVKSSVNFSLTTLAKADVEWNFGDGRTIRGNPVTHTFDAPGKREVSVTVTDPRSRLSETASISIEVVRYELKLDPFKPPYEPNKPYSFQASSEGEFLRYMWVVDGSEFKGAPRSDGAPGTTLSEYVFERPGEAQITVWGETRQGSIVKSDTRVVSVKPLPLLRVTSPSDRDVLYFGETRELRAEIEASNSQRVRFTLLANGEAIVPPKEVDVSNQGLIRVADWKLKVPDLKGQVKAELLVEALDSTPALKRSVAIVLERSPTTLEIELPDGREPYINRPARIRAAANAPITGLMWDFGEGDGLQPGGFLEQHTWKRYGSFTVRAVAKDADGTLIESSSIPINVPIRRVSVQPRLIYEGKVVGQDIDRVPVNATLKIDPGVDGDVTRVLITLDGEPYGTSPETLIVKTRGAHRFHVKADGTAEAGSDEREIAFHTSDPVRFWALLVAVASLLTMMGWLLLGNRWRFAEFQVRTDGDWNRRDSSGRVQPDAQPRRLGAGKGRDICGRWNYLTKKAAVRIASLDNVIGEQLAITGYEREFRWKDEQIVLFSGTDTPLVVRGAPIGAFNVATKARRDRLNQGEPKSTDWLVCWTLLRDLPSSRPEGMRPGPTFEAMAIFMRLRVPGGGFMYWLELLFGLLALAAVASGFWLYNSFY